MPSTFPPTIDTWSDRQDGVHDVLAADVNELAAFIIAAQTRIGASGATAGAANHEGWLKALAYYGLLQRGTPTASAATVTLPTDGTVISITGTTPITDLAASDRVRLVILEFAAALTVTHGNLIALANSQNFVTVAGDYLVLHWTGSLWREVARSRPLGMTGYATTAELADVAAAEAAGTSTTVARGDHVHTVGAGVITDAMVAAANKDGSAGTASLRTLGTGAMQAAAGNDARLSDARTPTAHAASHVTGGSDVIATFTTTARGLVPPPGGTPAGSLYLNDLGAWTAPAAGGDGSFARTFLFGR